MSDQIAAQIHICEGGGCGLLRLCVPRGMRRETVGAGVADKVPSTRAGWRMRYGSPEPCSHGDPSRYHCTVEALP